MLFGTLFTLTFTSFPLTYALWVGIFTFVHAEAIFSILKKASLIKTNDDQVDTDTPNNEENVGDPGEG